MRKTYDILGAQSPFQEDRGIVARAGIHSDDGIGGPGLVRECGQGPGEIGTAVVGDHNGSDMYFLKN
ncbi:MAG: hypothetical protein NVS2B15_14720 [Pseudarthrobacter sp.]